jgi:peptidoglycan/LPS O-acetylase OafA/YrhL
MKVFEARGKLFWTSRAVRIWPATMVTTVKPPVSA